MNLKINKLRIEGDKYRRTLTFNEGLNIIAGDIYSGKSLILRLIDYVLGKTNINLEAQKELAENCDKVYLEIEINKHIYSIKRNLKFKKNKFFIFFTDFNNLENFTPKVFEKDDYLKFLLNLLDIPEYKLLRNKAHSKSKTSEIISIRDIFRFCYIDQHNFGTNNFLEKLDINKARKNKPTLDLILNLIIDDKDGIREEVIKKTGEKLENEKMITSLKAYIIESDIDSIENLNIKKENAQKELNELIENKKNIKKVINQKKGDTNIIFKKLNSDLNSIEKEILDLKMNLNDITLEILSKSNLKTKFLEEINEAEMTKEANFYLAESEQEVRCPLCNSAHANKTVESLYDNDSLDSIIKDSKDKIRALTNIINGNHYRKSETEKKLTYFDSKKTLIMNAIQSYTEDLDIPMLSEIEAVDTLIYKYRQSLVEIKENIKMYNKIKEKEIIIEQLDSSLIELQKKLDSLFKDENIIKDILETFNTYYIEFLNKIDIPIEKGGTYLSENDYIPYYDNASVYQHDSGGILASIQIAFLGALLKISNSSKFKIQHPNFLLLDTIGKYLGKNKDIYLNDDTKIDIMDENIYNNIYDVLIELSNQSQIIVVENTPRSCDSKFIKYIFTKQNNETGMNSSIGLIDLNKNEF
ncbi:MAG: hypothetical protein JW924_05005 [Fusobacteriaceae bacterium]|nr:hypothetical protein [Fusobacteriaceae bacterium]